GSRAGAAVRVLGGAGGGGVGIAVGEERDELLLLLLRQGVEPASVASAVVAVGLLRHVTPPQGAVIIRDARWNRGRPRAGIRRPLPDAPVCYLVRVRRRASAGGGPAPPAARTADVSRPA